MNVLRKMHGLNNNGFVSLYLTQTLSNKSQIHKHGNNIIFHCAPWLRCGFDCNSALLSDDQADSLYIVRSSHVRSGTEN